MGRTLMINNIINLRGTPETCRIICVPGKQPISWEERIGTLINLVTLPMVDSFNLTASYGIIGQAYIMASNRTTLDDFAKAAMSANVGRMDGTIMADGTKYEFTMFADGSVCTMCETPDVQKWRDIVRELNSLP